MGLPGVDQKVLSSPRHQLPSSLHGSLASFPLADVLGLLASTGSTGVLEVSGGRTEGCVFLDDGAVVAATTGAKDTPVDVVVELLRLEDGDFTFEPDEIADHPGPPVGVPGLLAEARARLEEWHAIEAVLPSVNHVVVLASEAPAVQVVLTGSQWRAVAAIGDGGPIGPLLEQLADDDLDALRLLRGLVEAGLVDVVDPSTAPPGPFGGRGDEQDPTAGQDAPVVEAPVIIVRSKESRPRTVDPALDARLDAIAEQFDVVYEVAHAATADDAGSPVVGTGLFAKLRHRHDR